MSRWLAGTLLVGVLGLGVAPSASASPPANDNFANADVVGSLPFTDSGDLTGLTAEPGEPSAGPCLPSPSQTAWYVFTPTTSGPVLVDPAGSAFTVNVVAYQASGSGFGGLSLLACGGGFGSFPINLSVTAGTTYYLQVGLFVPGPSFFQLRVDAVTPPANDNFAAAAPLSGAPVSATVDLKAATIEPGEPEAGGLRASAWYAYTPASSGTYLVRPTFDPANVLTVFTGTSLADLTVIAGSAGPGNAIFSANAGTTYFVRVAQGGPFPGFSSVVTITIEQPGPPVAGFGFFPFDPSIHDTVQFFDSSFDPAFIGFGPAQWDFGDGTTTTGCCVNHRYAADGDYTVTLIATTHDGRTATTTQVVAVRTHDVSIERIQAPNTAQVGQTKTVRVNVRGGAYAETVQVDLFRSTAGGFEQFVGTQTLPVPAGHRGRTTSFEFRYAFTPDDGATGKVTFRAVATIVGARDALPADNQAIAPPTKVTG